MSLIVLRNDDTQAPNSFQNSFTNTFEVEPNSEIALHSIALNRAPKYDISDRFFYVYHGEQLDESAKPEDLMSCCCMGITLVLSLYIISELCPFSFLFDNLTST